MYPIYGHMDSYPHQMPYAPSNPNLESIPYQMKPDLPKSPSPYEYSPYGINNYYHHPHPMEFHSCCNHNYFPSCYTFRPPYSHFPPPPPQQPFHCHYTPRPHYPMELPPRYDYDKIATRDHHCCGCPNHSCTRKDDQIVKIEEPDPDAEKKTSDSLVPHQLKNYPYPVVWIPPSYLRNKEDRKGKPVEERKENSKSFEEESRFLNGWLPLDMNKLGSMMQGEDGRKVENQKNDEEGRFPFSIFRVPYKPEELEMNGPKENKLPSHFSITPVDASDTEDSKSKSRGSEGDSDSVRMIIPEKKEKNVEKKTEKENEGKAKNIPVEFRTDNGERKIVKNSEKRRSSSLSPPKSSKLPPVCLRIDPLPGKKSISRSPSPPANKGKSEKSTSENSKNSVEENCPENMQSSKPVEKSKERKVIEVVENDSKNGKTKDKNVILGQSGDGKCDVGEGKVESEMIKEKADKEENKVRRKILSDDEAAMIIQSVYRGYEVRKWEPLIKLKQIAKVKDQAAEVKRNIEGLKSSSADVQSDDKQRLVIGETIMSLLLKLDTIQGLHPSIRDIRKSAARELVSLQEKLDALTTKKPIEDLSTTATSEAVENMEPMLVDKEERGDLENKSTESPAANEEANVEEQKDKVQDTENHEDLELEQSNEITTHPLVTQDNACSDELLKEMPASGEEENDEKLLEKAQGEEFNHADEAAVVEDINGEAEESTVHPLEDEAMKADGVVLPLKAEEQKPEHSCAGEENDEKALEEAKLGAEVQPEEAQQKEVDIADESAVVAEAEITGKTEESVVQPLEAEVTHANDEVQVIEAEEPRLKLAYMEDEVKNADDIVQVVEAEEPQPKDANDIVQTVEAEEPQPKLPCVESEASTEELTETHVIKEANGESSELGDIKLTVHNIIAQPNGDTEPKGSEEKLREENEKLKEIVEKLVEAGKEQLSAISSLSGKVKDLERKLSKKKKLKMRKCVKKSRILDDQMVC